MDVALHFSCDCFLNSVVSFHRCVPYRHICAGQVGESTGLQNPRHVWSVWPLRDSVSSDRLLTDCQRYWVQMAWYWPAQSGTVSVQKTVQTLQRIRWLLRCQKYVFEFLECIGLIMDQVRVFLRTGLSLCSQVRTLWSRRHPPVSFCIRLLSLMKALFWGDSICRV